MITPIDEVSGLSRSSQSQYVSPYERYMRYMVDNGVDANAGASNSTGFGTGQMPLELILRMEEILLAAMQLLIQQLRQMLPGMGGGSAGGDAGGGGGGGPCAMGSASPAGGMSGSGGPGGMPWGGGRYGASSPYAGSPHGAGMNGSPLSTGMASGPAGVSSLAPSGPLTGGPSLKNNAAQSGMFVGTAVSPKQLDDPELMSRLSQQFGVMTSENSMKWSELDAKGYDEADNMVAKADEYGMKVRGHTLVWHQQMPDRINNMSAAQVEQEMTSHISDTLQHFGNKVGTWDVVNEAFADGGNGGYRDSAFSRAMGGQGFIDKAFLAARQAAPNAELVLNDYNIETLNPKSDQLYEAVKSMKERGIPIDAVGMQAHVAVGQDLSSMAANIKRFTDLGVNVQITEFDVKGGDAAAKAQVAHEAFAAAKEGGASGFVFWGYRDADQSYAANPNELFDSQGNIRSDMLQAFS
jgi:GH35 family endo-1,4-beta-xylanase